VVSEEKQDAESDRHCGLDPQSHGIPRQTRNDEGVPEGRGSLYSKSKYNKTLVGRGSLYKNTKFKYVEIIRAFISIICSSNSNFS
jgi:hypothetical protein